MTAYELFERAYRHYMGQFLGNLWSSTETAETTKKYIAQTFYEVTEEYSIEFASNVGFMLVYGADSTEELRSIEDLKGFNLQSGHWLCRHDGHSGEWWLLWSDSKTAAKETYLRLYSRYYKRQEWYWTVKVIGCLPL